MNRALCYSLTLLACATSCKAAANLGQKSFYPLPIPISAFAGGFGTSSTTSKSSRKKSSKKKKRGGRLILDDDLKTQVQSNKNTETKQNEPQLDRFGLPIQTADDIFPPLPDDVELLPMGSNEKTAMKDVRRIMKQYIPLNFDIFDENGVELGIEDGNDRQPWKLNCLHKSPPVLSVENFFTPKECDEYIQLTAERSQNLNDDSSSPMKVNSATFSPLAQSKRTSTTWYCYFSQVPTILAKAKRLLYLSLDQIEEPQIVRYRTGEEFTYHYDEIPPPQLPNGGQRICTLLVYLNTIDEDRGGGTIFRDLKDPYANQLKMTPKRGSALLFFPALNDGTPDDRTLHKGEKAVDEKMIAQMWIHERSYQAVVPSSDNHQDDARKIIEQKEL